MKKVADLLKVLQKANPHGFVIILDETNNKKGHFVTGPANLNVITYGYVNSKGKDITQGKKDGDIVGLPYYSQALIESPGKENRLDESPGYERHDPIMGVYWDGKVEGKSGKMLSGYEHIAQIHTWIERLQKFPPNAPLVSFDGHLIKMIAVNGKNQISYYTSINGEQSFHSKPTDFVILIKGEKLKHTFKPDSVKKQNENVIKLTQKNLVDICEDLIKKKTLLSEQIVSNYDKLYDYKKENNNYFYKKKSDLSWKLAKGPGLEAIKSRVFKEKPATGKVKFKSKQPAQTPQQNPQTQTPNPFTDELKTKSDTFSPQQDSAKFKAEVNYQEYENFKNGIVSTKKSASTPLHIRCLQDFLTQRKSPLVDKDLTHEELQAVLSLIQFEVNRKRFKSGGLFNFYNTANAYQNSIGGTEKIKFKEKNLGVDQTNVQEKTTQVAFTLGNATVTDDGNNYIVKDNYDFNNYQNHPEDYTVQTFPKTLKDGLVKIGSGNYVQGIEQIISVFHKLGYPGYPVNLVIPKNLV
jgi:hypothetical protein